MNGSGPRPEVRWPLYVTVWCFVAAVAAMKTGGVIIPALAALQAITCWVLYATGEPNARQR